MPRTSRPLAPVGAHVSVAGGLVKALPRADAVGAEVLQVFVANPRGWAPPADDPAGDAALRAACGRPVFVHAPYLINFGSPSAQTLARSSEALRFSLVRGRAIGARGVVVHAGSAVLGNRWDDAMAQVREHVLPVLDSVPDGPQVLIEATAGGGGALASDAKSLGAYLDVLGRDERVGVCLDTCHMHASGHDLSVRASFAAALRAYSRAAGRGRIGLVHVNDSRDDAGSRRDRHEALGRGTIGVDAFGALFGSPATRHVPMVVETADADHAADIAPCAPCATPPAPTDLHPRGSPRTFAGRPSSTGRHGMVRFRAGLLLVSVRIAEERRVATWPELLRRGHSAARIRAQLDAGRWRRWGRAIVLHNGPLSPRERWFVARAHGAPGAMLTSFTALEAVGLRGWERDETHVLTALGARNSTRCPVPVRFHRVRDRSAARRYPHTRTQIPRQAAVLAAGSLPTARPACGILAAVVQQRIAAPASLRSVVQASPRVRHRRHLLLTIADIEQGADALSEIDFVALCRRNGLPPPVLQTVRHEAGGRRRYLDASWRRPDGRLLAVEVDGALHLSQRQWWTDQARQNELVLADTILLRYPSVVVRTEGSTVVDQLRRGLLLPDRPASVSRAAH